MNNIEHINGLLDSVQRRKSMKPAYRKTEAIRGLEDMVFDFHYRDSTLPQQYRMKFRFRDDSANGLTTCVIQYLKIKGAFVTRLNSTGIYRVDLKKYVPNTQKRGLGDILATIKGIPLQIEVKIGKDRMSSAQLKVKDEFERSGGIYFVAHNFTDFKPWFDMKFSGNEGIILKKMSLFCFPIRRMLDIYN